MNLGERTVSTRISVGGLAALLVLSLVGCAASGPTMLRPGDTTAMVSWTDQSGMDALLTGEVTIDDGCWGITDDAGTVHQVVWPKGTTLDDEGLHVPGTTDALLPGTWVDAAGGEIGTVNLGNLPSCWDAGTPVFLSWTAAPSR